MIRKLIFKLRERHSLYVIADPRDNSISFSKRLFEKLDIMNKDAARVMVFRVTGTGHYAFSINPPLEQETQLADVMYNDKHRTVGFECLVPTVNRIFYDYGLLADKPCKLSVRRCTVAPADSPDSRFDFWTICKPIEK